MQLWIRQGPKRKHRIYKLCFEKPNSNWGVRGRFGKSPDFSAFFFVKPSLTKNFFLYFEIIHCTEMLCFLNCKENICAFKNYPPKCSDRSSFDGRGENWKVSHGHTSGAAFFFKVFTFCCTFLLATLQVMLFKIMFCFCVTVVSPSKQWFRGKEEPLGKNFLHMLKKSFKFCPGRIPFSRVV